jgi:hypothetical protein
MDYKSVDGPVYCRYAGTPPVINSPDATRIGIKATSTVELEEGRNVKLRLVLDDNKKRMTCHAIIDWVRPSKDSEDFVVGFSQLSLTDSELKVLRRNLVDESRERVELSDRVRDKGLEYEPIVQSDEKQDIKRIKAVTLPVGLIELIDAKRGTVGFSDFVSKILYEHLKEA